jgi:lysozyme
MEKYGITEDEAYFLFDRDYNRVVSSLHGKFPWYDNQPKEVQNILINMAFNLGLNRLSRFKKTIKFITEKKYAQAAVEMLDSKWANQVGDRAIRLSERMKRCR